MLSWKLRLSLLLEIEEGDVLKALLHLNLNKACGTDGTSAKLKFSEWLHQESVVVLLVYSMLV